MENNDQEVKTVCFTILTKLAASGLQHVFEKWVERCKKCITFQGKYFKKKKKECHHNSTQFQLRVKRQVHKLFKQPSYVPRKEGG
jgi:hypothetical protein